MARIWKEPRKRLLWYERLPLYLRKEGKRQRVVKALEQALEQFSNEKSLIKKTLKASDLPVISPHPYSKADAFASVAWCHKCQKLLGQGLCRQCKKSKSRSGYRVPHCNNCNIPLGQGLCEGCQRMRKKLEETYMTFQTSSKLVVRLPRKAIAPNIHTKTEGDAWLF